MDDHRGTRDAEKPSSRIAEELEAMSPSELEAADLRFRKLLGVVTGPASAAPPAPEDENEDRGKADQIRDGTIK